MEEINSLPANLPKEPVMEGLTYEDNNDNCVEQPQPSKPQQPLQPSGGGSNPADKNGNGIDDEFENNRVEVKGGSATPYDGPPLGSWGDEP